MKTLTGGARRIGRLDADDAVGHVEDADVVFGCGRQVVDGQRVRADRLVVRRQRRRRGVDDQVAGHRRLEIREDVDDERRGVQDCAVGRIRLFNCR